MTTFPQKFRLFWKKHVPINFWTCKAAAWVNIADIFLPIFWQKNIYQAVNIGPWSPISSQTCLPISSPFSSCPREGKTSRKWRCENFFYNESANFFSVLYISPEPSYDNYCLTAWSQEFRIPLSWQELTLFHAHDSPPYIPQCPVCLPVYINWLKLCQYIHFETDLRSCHSK
jgi:hypothetical protein